MALAIAATIVLMLGLSLRPLPARPRIAALVALTLAAFLTARLLARLPEGAGPGTVLGVVAAWLAQSPIRRRRPAGPTGSVASILTATAALGMIAAFASATSPASAADGAADVILAVFPYEGRPDLAAAPNARCPPSRRLRTIESPRGPDGHRLRRGLRERRLPSRRAPRRTIGAAHDQPHARRRRARILARSRPSAPGPSARPRRPIAAASGCRRPGSPASSASTRPERITSEWIARSPSPTAPAAGRSSRRSMPCRARGRDEGRPMRPSRARLGATEERRLGPRARPRNSRRTRASRGRRPRGERGDRGLDPLGRPAVGRSAPRPPRARGRGRRRRDDAAGSGRAGPRGGPSPADPLVLARARRRGRVDRRVRPAVHGRRAGRDRTLATSRERARVATDADAFPRRSPVLGAIALRCPSDWSGRLDEPGGAVARGEEAFVASWGRLPERAAHPRRSPHLPGYAGPRPTLGRSRLARPSPPTPGSNSARAGSTSRSTPRSRTSPAPPPASTSICLKA